MQEIAAVDLGSNSFHMIVARLEDGRLQLTDKVRERVRLGGGLDADGNITEEAANRAIACLERFGQRVRGMERTAVRAVGTNTLRRARNGAEFVARAKAALGHRIDIIAGREEARLIYLGVAQTTGAEEGRRLVMDIGGGSTEFIVGDGFEILDADSLFMGCVSYSNQFFAKNKVTGGRFERAEIAAQLELRSVVGRDRKLDWSHALGCSGTIHAVSRIVRANGWDEDGHIKVGDLRRLKAQLVAHGSTTTIDLPGLEDDRRPVIAGGVAILLAAFEALAIEEMVRSPGALREGLIYDLAGRIQHEDVRDRTIRGLAKRYGQDAGQARRVDATAQQLLTQVPAGWELRSFGSTLLAWASQLHEIGNALSHTAYHKHGAYIVANTDMAGFSRGEQRMIAALIGGQRRKIKPELLDGLREHWKPRVEKLLVLFRLAVTLHRSRYGDLDPPVVLRAKGKQLRLAFEDGWLSRHPLTQMDLEQEAQYLSALGYELKTIEAARPRAE